MQDCGNQREKMMRMRSMDSAAAFVPTKESPGGAADEVAAEWEIRPGGMLVQKRNPESDAVAAPVPTIRVKVKHGSVYHEIYLSSQSTFGELKKLVAARTGLHPGDQKVVFKDKERDSAAYLDTAGVRDGSKVVVLEDPTAQAKRFLEMRRAAKAEKAAKAIAHISLEVDKLAAKVSALEAIVSKGKRVAEGDVLSLIELLMNQLIKLDGVVADGDAKLQRGMQVRRVQKYVEKLDMLKVKNSMHKPSEQTPAPPPQQLQQPQYQRHQQHQLHHQQQQRQQPQPSAVVTTNWEMFDLLSAPSTSAATSTTTAAAIRTAAPAASAPIPRFDWELF